MKTKINDEKLAGIIKNANVSAEGVDSLRTVGNMIELMDDFSKQGSPAVDIEMLGLRASLKINSVLEKNPGLHPFAGEISEYFLNKAEQASTKSHLETRLQNITKKYQPKALGPMQEGNVKVAQEPDPKIAPESPPKALGPMQEGNDEKLARIIKNTNVSEEGVDSLRTVGNMIELMDDFSKQGSPAVDIEMLGLRASLKINSVLEKNPGLHPFAGEISEYFLNKAEQASTKSHLETRLQNITKKYQPKALGPMQEGNVKVAQEPDPKIAPESPQKDLSPMQEGNDEKLAGIIRNTNVSEEGVRSLRTVLNIISVMDGLSKQGSPAGNIETLAAQVSVKINFVLEKNPGLHPFAGEISEYFLNKAEQASTKSHLETRLQNITEKYQPKDLSPIIQELNELSNDENLAQKLGAKNAKEFADKVATLDKEYKEAPEKQKASVLLNNLSVIDDWVQEKQKDLKVSVFSKIGEVISSYTKAVIFAINGNDKKASDHILNASQKIKELTSGKEMSQELDKVNKKPSWVETVKNASPKERTVERDR